MKFVHFNPQYSAIDQSRLLTKYSYIRSINNIMNLIVSQVGNNTIYSWKPSVRSGFVHNYSDIGLSKRYFGVNWEDADQNVNYDVALVTLFTNYASNETYESDIPDLMRCLDKVNTIIYFDADVELWSDHNSTVNRSLLLSCESGEFDLSDKLKVIICIDDDHAQRNQKVFPYAKCIGIPNLDYPEIPIKLDYIQKSKRTHDIVEMKGFKAWNNWFDRTKAFTRLHALENLGLLKKRLDRFSAENSHFCLTRSHLSAGSTTDIITEILKSSLSFLTMVSPFTSLNARSRLTTKIFETRNSNMLPIFDGRVWFINELTKNIPKFFIYRDSQGHPVDSFDNVVNTLSEMSDSDYESAVFQYRKNVFDTFHPSQWMSEINTVISYI